MSEPKRYSPDPPLCWEGNFRESSTGIILRADDPAVLEAFKDAEDLTLIKRLVGAGSGNDILKWKRSHEAMEKLERIAQECNPEIFHANVDGRYVILTANNEISAPTLIEAIESVKEGA